MLTVAKKRTLLFIITGLLVVFVIYKLFFYYEAPPKIIWTYWNTTTIPPNVQEILRNRANVLTSWQQIILSDTTLDNYVNPPPDVVNTLIPQHKADWLRLALLKKYGGCWMDATIVVNSEKEMNELYDLTVSKQAEFTGFYTPRHIINNDISTFVENSCMIAPRNSRLISTWYNEYMRACTMGFSNYRNMVRSKYTFSPMIYNQDNEEVYLTAYGAFQVSYQHILKKEVKIVLLNSFEYIYKLHWECFNEKNNDYDHDCITSRLRDDPSVKQMAFIKITNHTRKVIEKLEAKV